MERIAALQYKITSNNKKPKSFGTDKLLYQSEIHFIDAVGTEDAVNASQLSEKLGVSNGAITQVADKLSEKGLIKKYKKDTNRKEVYFRLTEQGKVAYENHKNFHRSLREKITAYLEGLSPKQIEGILGLLSVSDENLPDLP